MPRKRASSRRSPTSRQQDNSFSARRGARRASCVGNAAPFLSFLADRRNPMANTIVTDDCTSCAACEPECPTSAISEGPDAYVIDAAKCDECASNGGEPACMAVCPTDCIVKMEA